MLIARGQHILPSRSAELRRRCIMKRFSLVLALGMSVSGHAQEYRPTPIPPTNLYGGQFTVLPNGSILPTQPLVNTLQPIQQDPTVALHEGRVHHVQDTDATTKGGCSDAEPFADQADKAWLELVQHGRPCWVVGHHQALISTRFGVRLEVNDLHQLRMMNAVGGVGGR